MLKFLSRPRRFLLAAGIVLLGGLPAVAQTALFDSLTMPGNLPNQASSVEGFTAGFYSLTSIVNRDSNGNFCLGFADSTPDHILVLEQDFSELALQVDSGGQATTLLVQGPNDNTIRCAVGTRRSPDAVLQDANWRAGTYRVWVGAFEQGNRYNYVLTATP
ncbi:MAG: hypothetical protein HC886_20125 [Leptolyngbyaceae cyanobacterium SM1_1_3]|nr:hypothetical protein [Leptolyngbyaceae cyanobacterium SM1_1_3]NJN04541.1 hypothetical protein [Leptolyngbyaceae cyanobacterium RM1_1_2]NJO08414.1 hypothetical protein [Leptolyngbyaceae cyanobacterium SL_1_1]